MKQQAALTAEVFDPLAQAFFGGIRIGGETGEAEELRRAPVDHLLVDPDLVVAEDFAALLAAGLFRALAVHGLFLDERAAQDPAVVGFDPGAEMTEGDAGLFFPVDQRPVNRGAPPIFGKKGSMNVDRAKFGNGKIVF